MPTLDDVTHLMRRAGFGCTYAEAQNLTGTPIDQIVDGLLDPTVNPPDTRPAFMTDPNTDDYTRQYMLTWWWLDRMATSTTPLQEKLSLFWHGHFATQNSKVADMNLMFDQNSLFRNRAMGNFRDDLVHPMSLQPAMLLYLDGAYNVAGNANENFARELMELFTLGVNQYTQADIMAAAKAWTGYNVADDDRTQYQYYDNHHDQANKTFMGVTQPWNGPQIIDFLLSGNATKKMTAAKFMALKLWTFFAAPNPTVTLRDSLAQVFYDNDLEVAPLLKAIFTAPEFYTASVKNGLVRTPAAFIAAALKHTGLTSQFTNPHYYLDDMGQVLFEPPNVAGWKSNATWLSSSGLWRRADWVYYLVLNRIVTFNNANPNSKIIRDTVMPPLLSGTGTQRFLDAADTVLQTLGIFNATTNTRRAMAAAGNRQFNSRGNRERTWMHMTVMALLSPEFNLA